MQYDYLKVVVLGSTWWEVYRNLIDPMASPTQRDSSGILGEDLGQQKRAFLAPGVVFTPLFTPPAQK